uniref:Uncharacterized protein n=2 Tax=Lygus hesperus TaxID=30085 RepID=A0A146KP20_LYGHE
MTSLAERLNKEGILTSFVKMSDLTVGAKYSIQTIQRVQRIFGSSVEVTIDFQGNLSKLSLPKRFHSIIRDDEMLTYKSGDLTLQYLGMMGNAYNVTFLSRESEKEADAEKDEVEENENLLKSKKRRKH